MLEPRPDDRPPSMRALLGYDGVGGPKPAASAQRAPGRPRRVAMLAIGSVAAFAILFGAAFFVLRELKPPPSTAELRTALAAVTTSYQCAAIHYAVDPDRSVHISGYVASHDDIVQIREAVGLIDGIRRLDFAVQLRIWPYCEILVMLRGLIEHPPHVPASLASSPTRDAARLGEPLVVDVHTPSFDSYVYVDYFDRQGEVLHLFPNGRDRLNFRPAQNHLVLGRPPFARCWVLGGTTGEQLVTLVAATDPLFSDPRPEVEDAHIYLPLLSQAVASLSPKNRAAARQFFQLEVPAPYASLEKGCR
jgi:hypothetical protein